MMPTFNVQLLGFSIDRLQQEGYSDVQIVALVTLHLKMPLWPAHVELVDTAVRELNGREPIYVATGPEAEAA